MAKATEEATDQVLGIDTDEETEDAAPPIETVGENAPEEEVESASNAPEVDWQSFIQTWTPASGFRQLKMLVYGDSGAGKTTFASSAPDVLFLDADNGLLSLEVPVKRWPIRTWPDLQMAYRYLATQPHQFKTVVLDSLNRIQRIGMDNVVQSFNVRRNYDNLPTQADWGKALDDLYHLILAFQGLAMNVIFTAATGPRSFEDDQLMPQLSGKQTANVLCQAMDVIGYIYKQQGEGQETQRFIGFDMPNAITKDRTRRLPTILQNPTWPKLAAYWED
jgi:GTPase SAR1 family protein